MLKKIAEGDFCPRTVGARLSRVSWDFGGGLVVFGGGLRGVACQRDGTT
jgi:hypothetical protein